MTFTCNICKKAPRQSGYRRKYQWKTQRGLDNHKCYKDDQKRALQQKEKYAAEQKELLEKAIRNAEHEIGETIHFWGYTVTKPTHVYRGTRLVHVRYEEERSYWNDSGTITEITIKGYKIGVRAYDISKLNLCETKEIAIKIAAEKGAKYKESCDFSSRCR